MNVEIVRWQNSYLRWSKSNLSLKVEGRLLKHQFYSEITWTTVQKNRMLKHENYRNSKGKY